MDERNEKDIVNPEETTENEDTLKTYPYGEPDQQGTPPPGYERNGRQGAPPPGYERNGWQGTPPPGYGGYGQGMYPPYNPPKKSNIMALASLILGILSIVLCCCGGFGMILGAVGIVLAILSRGKEPMETNAKVGLGLSLGGIVLGILVLVLSFAIIGSEEFRRDLDRGGYGNYENYRHYFEHGGL